MKLRHISHFPHCSRLIAAFAMLTPPTLLAAVDDELKGEQAYSVAGIPEAEKSFWDPSFWRDMTPPLESPIVPGPSNWLYFGRKAADGTPYAEPARDLTLYTAAHSGFTPPAVPPVFSRVWFSGDQIVFNGTPDVSGAPLGRFIVGTPHPFYMTNDSRIEFDHTIVDVDNLQVYAQASLVLTGDVTASGGTYNFRNTGPSVTYRAGARPDPIVLLRDGAIGQFSGFYNNYVLTPTPPNTGNAPVVKIESGSSFAASSLLLTNAAGTIIDASTGSGTATIGGISTSGGVMGADPLVLFHASGTAAPLPLPSFTVSNMSTLDGFSGTLADMENGSSIAFNNVVAITGTGGNLGLRARTNSSIHIFNIDSVSVAPGGSTRLDWQASSGGSIALDQVMGFPLHLNALDHHIAALSGGTLDIPSNLGVDAGGQVIMSASGAGSTLQLDGTSQIAPYDYLSNPALTFGNFSLNITSGATLRGGALIDFGGGSFYPDIRTLYITRSSGGNSVTVTGSTVENLNLTLNQTNSNLSIGTLANPATLHQVNLDIGDTSILTLRSGTWQPERVEIANFSQSLQVGDVTGGSIAHITNAAVIHSLDMRVGNGVYLAPGAPPPTVNDSILTIDGGTTATGSLSVARMAYGKGTVNISGAGTTCGFRNVQLGLIPKSSRI